MLLLLLSFHFNSSLLFTLSLSLSLSLSLFLPCLASHLNSSFLSITHVTINQCQLQQVDALVDDFDDGNGKVEWKEFLKAMKNVGDDDDDDEDEDDDDDDDEDEEVRPTQGETREP